MQMEGALLPELSPPQCTRVSKMLGVNSHFLRSFPAQGAFNRTLPSWPGSQVLMGCDDVREVGDKVTGMGGGGALR